MDIAGAVQSVVDRLTAAGIRAVLDERDINPPAVYVAPPAVEWRFHKGDFTATFTAWCVTGAAGRRTDLANVAELVQLAGAALDWAQIRADPADLLVPDMAVPLPAYRLTWSQRFTTTTAPNPLEGSP